MSWLDIVVFKEFFLETDAWPLHQSDAHGYLFKVISIKLQSNKI
jgi:hypothetical protein